MKILKTIIAPFFSGNVIQKDILWFVSVLFISFIIHKIFKKIISAVISRAAKKLSARSGGGKLGSYFFKYIHFERLALFS